LLTARLFLSITCKMISINGNIQKESNCLIDANRGFLYGDALFDTMIFKNDTLVYYEAHYFRLLASMRQLRMEIPSFFTQDYWKKEIYKTIKANSLKEARVRTTIYRNSLGLYTPASNNIHYLIQVTSLKQNTKPTYKLGIYKDNYLNANPLSNIKTTNRVTNILASIFAKENDFDTCLLLNNKKQVAEVIHANIFIIKNNIILTPPLTEGCINGIVRSKIIKLLKKSTTYQILENEITSFDVLHADEVFISNSVIEIQPVTHFKKKVFSTDFTMKLQKELDI